MPEPVRLPRSIHGKSALTIARHAALESGKILQKRFSLPHKSKSKGRRNLVTEADLQSEKKIIGIIRAEFPGHGIVSEEAGELKAEREYKWIIDPLDGTNNYFFGIPIYCVNIALVRRGEPVLGLTYDPVRKELFQAVRGKGAYLNGRKIRVSGVQTLERASAGVDLGYNPERSRELLEIQARLWGQVHLVRLLGSSALGMAYAACGRLGLYFHKYVYPWDIAAGLLLVREAGGEVTDFKGRPVGVDSHEIVAGSKRLNGLFLEWLNK